MRGTVRARRSVGTPASPPRSEGSRGRCCRSGRTIPGPRRGTRNGDANPWRGAPYLGPGLGRGTNHGHLPRSEVLVKLFTSAGRSRGRERPEGCVPGRPLRVIDRRTVVLAPRRPDRVKFAG